ncbi:MAG: hypothetical protein ACI9GW_001412 [Halieaceae bacterium]|jgi:hypothetical protein
MNDAIDQMVRNQLDFFTQTFNSGNIESLVEGFFLIRVWSPAVRRPCSEAGP